MSTDLVHLSDRGDIGAVMRPVGSVTELRAAFEAYQELTKSLLTDDDHQTISGKRFRKKSAWRKLSTAFGVTFKISDRTITYDDDGHVLRAEFVVTATAPNGRSMDGWGGCDLKEKCCGPDCKKKKWSDHTCCPQGCSGAIHFSHANHDIPATAETRAKNRAASDLFGMGEVSAEEVMDSGEGEPRQATQNQPPDKAPKGPVSSTDHGALVAAIKAKAPNHPKVKSNQVSSMNPEQLVKLAKALGIEVVDSPVSERAESPTKPEGGEPVGVRGSAPTDSPSEGDWEAHWAMIAETAGVTLEQVESTLKATAGGKSIQSLKNVSPHSPIGEKLERAMLGSNGAAA